MYENKNYFPKGIVKMVLQQHCSKLLQNSCNGIHTQKAKSKSLLIGVQ